MLTIDWKERLNKDTDDFLQNKLPNNDFDFEIIFNAYPERVNGKIPPEVIVHVSSTILSRLGKNHEKYLPFYRYLWDKKGDYGKTAFITFMAKLLDKKPAVYMPLVENAMTRADQHELAAIMEKIMLPLLKKHPQKYMEYVYKWDHNNSTLIRKSTINLVVKLMKKVPELIPTIVTHYSNQWLTPLGDTVTDHITMFKALAKIDFSAYVKVFVEHGMDRDPQTVEILCGTVLNWHKDIEEIVEKWTHSGNARVKKASTIAWRILLKKRPK